MSTNAGDGSGNSSSGAGAGNSSGGSNAGFDWVEFEKRFDERFNKASSARERRFEEKLDKFLDRLPKAPEAAAEVTQQAAGNVADGEKQTQKARIEALEKRLEGAEKARVEADSRAKDARIRSEVQSRLAAKLGADSPLVGPLMDSLYDVKKRFGEHEGQIAVKFKRDWGEEPMPLDKGIDELFANELKSLVVPASKAPNLPRSQSFLQSAGNPFAPPQQGQSGQSDVNPILGEFARHFAQHGDMNRANAILQAQPEPPVKK